MEVTQSLANDWARFGIRVNAIAPGVFPTPVNRNLVVGTPRGEWLLRHTPMGRFGEPEEVAGAAVYLASAAASYTTACRTWWWMAASWRAAWVREGFRCTAETQRTPREQGN